MELVAEIGPYIQYWIFPFGVYYHDYGEWLGLGRFLFALQDPYSSFSIIAVIWVVIGLILAAVVMRFRGSQKLTKMRFTILILLLSLQIVLPIVVIVLYESVPTYIFPLPIPFLVAILLLRHEGVQFMRESYFQGFLIFVSSLILPFTVVGFETSLESQEWFFPFGVYDLFFDEYLVLSRFYMLFHRSSFTIFAVVWVVSGLILAAEVITLLGSKKLTKKIFTILILLLTLQIVGPIVAVLLVYSRSLASVLYVIPLPIPFLVAVLLLRHSGVTLMPFTNLKRP